MKIGELLVKHSLISSRQLEQALAAQKQFGGKLGTNLVELNFISDEQLVHFLSRQLGVAGVSKQDLMNIKPEVIALVGKETAEKHQVVAYKLDTRLHVAVGDPARLEALDQLQYKIGKSIVKTIAPEIWIMAALERYYGITREIRHNSLHFFNEVPEDNFLHTLADFELPDPEAQKQKSLTPAFPIPVLVQQLQTCHSPSDVFLTLFRFLNPMFPKMAVLRISNHTFQGWLLSGIPVHLNLFQKFSMHVPNPTSSFGHMLSNKSVIVGEVGKIIPKEISFFLDIPDPETGFAYPFFISNEPRLVLMGFAEFDFTQNPSLSPLLTLAFTKANLQLDILYLQKKLEQ